MANPKTVETVRVTYLNGGHNAFINVSDFDPQFHELYVDPVVKAKAAPEKAVLKSIAEDAVDAEVEEPAVVEEPKEEDPPVDKRKAAIAKAQAAAAAKRAAKRAEKEAKAAAEKEKAKE